MKVLVSISCGMLNVFSVSYNERSKPINLGESSDGGEKRKIYQKLESHFVSLKP